MRVPSLFLVEKWLAWLATNLVILDLSSQSGAFATWPQRFSPYSKLALSHHLWTAFSFHTISWQIEIFFLLLMYDYRDDVKQISYSRPSKFSSNGNYLKVLMNLPQLFFWPQVKNPFNFLPVQIFLENSSLPIHFLRMAEKPISKCFLAWLYNGG